MKNCNVCNDDKSLLTKEGLCPPCYVYLGRKLYPERYIWTPKPSKEGCSKCGDGFTNRDEYCPELLDCDWYEWEVNPDEIISNYGIYCDCGFYVDGGEDTDPEFSEHSPHCRVFSVYEADAPAWCGHALSRHHLPYIDDYGWCRNCADRMGFADNMCSRCCGSYRGHHILRMFPERFCRLCTMGIQKLGKRDVPRSAFRDSTERFLWSCVVVVPDFYKANSLYYKGK